MKIKKWMRTGLLLLALSSAGCQMRRNIEVTLQQEEETEVLPEILELNHVKIRLMELDALTKIFLGESEESAEAYIPPYSKDLGEGVYYYEKDGCELHYVDGKRCEYADLSNGGVGMCYLAVWDPEGYGLVGGTVGGWLRTNYPLEDLESCSREEAIEICTPYAQAYGFDEDVDVSVYAMTLEALERVGSSHDWGHAPNLEYVVPGMDEIRKAAQTESSEKANELMFQRQQAASQGREWKKEDEALMLIYRRMIDGKLLNGSVSFLQMIYVPSLKKVVYANGGCAVETLETTERYENLISKETAVSEAIMAMGVKQENVEVESIVLGYYVSPTIIGAENGEALVPCWKIEYKQTEGFMEDGTSISVNGTILVNAVSGNVIMY